MWARLMRLFRGCSAWPTFSAFSVGYRFGAPSGYAIFAQPKNDFQALYSTTAIETTLLLAHPPHHTHCTAHGTLSFSPSSIQTQWASMFPATTDHCSRQVQLPERAAFYVPDRHTDKVPLDCEIYSEKRSNSHLHGVLPSIQPHAVLSEFHFILILRILLKARR